MINFLCLSFLKLIEKFQFTFYVLGSIIPWVGLLASSGRSVSLIEKWSCGSNTCPPEWTGKFCETEIGKCIEIFTVYVIMLY